MYDVGSKMTQPPFFRLLDEQRYQAPRHPQFIDLHLLPPPSPVIVSLYRFVIVSLSLSLYVGHDDLSSLVNIYGLTAGDRTIDK